MNMNKVPEGKTVFIKGRRYKSGEVLPSWALVEIPEMNEKEVEIMLKDKDKKNYSYKNKNKNKNSRNRKLY